MAGTRRRLVRSLRAGAFVLIGLLLPVGLYLAASVVGAYVSVHADYAPAADGQRVYVSSNGVHVDVHVPVRTPEMDWAAWLPMEEAGWPTEGWLAFGWGDRGFYLNTPTWDDLTLGTAVKAVVLPSPSAMHVTHSWGPPRASANVHVLDVSREGFARLIGYLRAGFRTDADGRPIVMDHPGYYRGSDRFFEAEGSYHLFRTCNHWTNGALKAAGVKTSLWAPFEWGVRRHLPR